MKAKELREKTIAELKAEVSKTKEALMKLRFSKAANQAKNLAGIRHSKRDVARCFTLIKEKETNEQGK